MNRQPQCSVPAIQANAVVKSADKFNHLLSYSKALLRVDEAADTLGFKRNCIYSLLLEGKLEAHVSERESPNGRRYRVTRRSVLAHLARTAQYDPDDFLDVLELLIETLSGPQIDRLMVRAQRIRQTKS
jgi:excisionase family DNA binding protein